MGFLAIQTKPTYMSNFLGIDIGGTNISFAVVDLQNEFLMESSFPTSSVNSAEELAEKIKSELAKSRLTISGIGIGAPSANAQTQKIEYAPNLNWGDIIPIGEIFKSVFDVEIQVLNDANAAALGEKYCGEANDLNNFAVVTLGTGVGLGLFVNNAVIVGDNGLAGELGHVVIHREGRECNCGNMGCLERYVGKEGIIQTAKEKLEFSAGGSYLAELTPSTITPEEIFKAARREDPVSLEVVDLVTQDLGFALAGLINVLDIENVFLMGGIARGGNILKRKTEKYMKSYLLPNIRDKVQIRMSSLNERNAGILGAAAAIRNKMEMVSQA